MCIRDRVKAVLKGYQVRFYTLTDLIAELYAALADNSLDRKINNILKNDLIILDELGYVSMDETASDHIFQLVTKAYENRSLIITSNLDFGEWGTLFVNMSTAAAILDRLLHHAHVFNLRGNSYLSLIHIFPFYRIWWIRNYSFKGFVKMCIRDRD